MRVAPALEGMVMACAEKLESAPLRFHAYRAGGMPSQCTMMQGRAEACMWTSKGL